MWCSVSSRRSSCSARGCGSWSSAWPPPAARVARSAPPKRSVHPTIEPPWPVRSDPAPGLELHLDHQHEEVPGGTDLLHEAWLVPGLLADVIPQFQLVLRGQFGKGW